MVDTLIVIHFQFEGHRGEDSARAIDLDDRPGLLLQKLHAGQLVPDCFP